LKASYKVLETYNRHESNECLYTVHKNVVIINTVAQYSHYSRHLDMTVI